MQLSYFAKVTIHDVGIVPAVDTFELKVNKPFDVLIAVMMAVEAFALIFASNTFTTQLVDHIFAALDVGIRIDAFPVEHVVVILGLIEAYRPLAKPVSNIVKET